VQTAIPMKVGIRAITQTEDIQTTFPTTPGTIMFLSKDIRSRALMNLRMMIFPFKNSDSAVFIPQSTKLKINPQNTPGILRINSFRRLEM
jgi:hypothetical protein